MDGDTRFEQRIAQVGMGGCFCIVEERQKTAVIKTGDKESVSVSSSRVSLDFYYKLVQWIDVPYGHWGSGIVGERFEGFMAGDEWKSTWKASEKLIEGE